MESQVASVAKTCYYQIRNIGQIRSFITSDACKILVHALVTSRLDYCNALLYGLPQTMLKRLQRVQNCAARLICRRKKHDHVTPLLKELHWLPIDVRSTYKLLAVATLWNQLPNSLRRIETLPLFRTHLKTPLFRSAFS